MPDLRRIAFMGLLFTAAISPALAWETRVDSDPFTDKKVAYSAQATDGGFLGLKCWEGGGPPVLMFSTGESFDASASYSSDVPGAVRFGKNDPIELTMNPRNVGGSLFLVAQLNDDDLRHKIFAQASDGPDRVGFKIGSIVLRFSGSGLKKSAQRLVETCGKSLTE